MEAFAHALIALLQKQVTCSGSRRKEVVCEKCAFRFEYELTRTITETGLSAPELLAPAAEARLKHLLDVECDPHPCPGCGWYQLDMVRHLREKSTASAVIWGAVLINVSIVCFMLAALGAEQPGVWGKMVALILAAAGFIAQIVLGYRVYRAFFVRINSSHAYDELNVNRTR